MEMQEDFRELLALFGKNKVEYIVVGAFALAYHGVPRYTGDLDILINAVPDNAENIIQALKAFGFGSLKLDPSDFTKRDQVVQLGYPPVRIDIITSITGVSWEEADAGKSIHAIGDLEIFFLGRKEFIRNKKETGRKKDLADLEALGEV
jgi:hypothetical protein